MTTNRLDFIYVGSLTLQIFITGGFSDENATTPVANAEKIYEYVPNSHFREVGSNSGSAASVGGAAMVSMPKLRDDTED